MDGDKTLLAKGTYPTLLADKAAALTVLDTALNTVKDKEDWLDDEDSLMYTKLEEYGITAKELPTDIHKEYAAQISAATTIEKDKDGNSVVAKEGAEKIESVLSDIKDQLVEAIKADYFAEIDKSNSLAGYDNAKVTLKGVIEGTIANFVYADKDDIKTVESYVSTEANGLIYEIENALNDAVVQNGLKAFKVERAQNAINEALVTYKAKVDKTLENDALYKSVFGSKNANGKYSTVKNVLSWDEDFGNPYATTNPVGKDNLTDGFVYTGTQANPAFDDHYNGFKTQLEALISDPNEIGVDTFTTIANQLTENLGYIDNIYKSVVARFKTDLFNKYVNDKLGDNTYVTSAKLEEVWNGNKDADTMTKLSELANQVNDSIKKLDNLDTKISEFVSGLDTKDPDYDLATNGKETEKAIDEFVEDAFVSAPSDSDVNSFVSSLGDLYKADVEAYFTDGKDFVKERYQNIIATGIDLPTYQKVKAVYDKAIADVTEKPLTTITAVNNWIGKTLAQLERFSGVTPVTPIEGTDEVTGEVTNVEGVYIIDSTPSSDSEGNPLTYTNGADLKVKGEKVSETESKVTLTGDVSGNKLSQEQANGVGYAVDNVYFTFSVEFDPTTQYLRTSFLEDVSSATETNNSQTGWKVIPTSNAENGSQLFVVAPYAHQGSKFTIQVVTQGETKTVVRTIVVDYTDLVTTASPTPDTETPTDPVE